MNQHGHLRSVVVSVARSSTHSFSKTCTREISLIKGLGVDGDAHMGATVKHRSRVKANPYQPNLRQVHLIGVELVRELLGEGFDIAPGQIGENIMTEGLDLITLPKGTRLRLGNEAVVEITGLRNPCYQLNDFRPGLMQAVLDRDENGNLIRKAGVMSVVLASGVVREGDAIAVELPTGPHEPLACV